MSADHQVAIMGGISRKQRRRVVREALGGADDNAKLRKIIGSRFRCARDINGWGQKESAALMGYTNSTQLSLIEDGKRMAPHSALLRAYRIYGVSIDYLMGVSDEPERDPKLAEQRAALAKVAAMMNGTASIILAQVQKYVANGVPAVASSRNLIRHAEACIASIERMHKLNRHAFEEDLRGSAAVMRTMDDLQREVQFAKSILDRNDRMVETTLKTAADRMGVEYPLFESEGEAL